MSISRTIFGRSLGAFLVAGLVICAGASAQFDTCPNPAGGDCFTATPGIPGCNDAVCCELVCLDLDFCCIDGWDQVCADWALEVCGGCDACGGATCGDCFVSNGSPFCDDVDCCNTVCAVDPFCCNNTWDGLCAGEALDLCNCLPGDAPANDDCANAFKIFLGTTDVTNECATPGGPEHAGCNDGFVVGLGVDVWYVYTADFTGTLGITPTAEPGWETQLAVYVDNDCAQLEDPPFACANLGGGVIINVVSGTSYLLRLGGTFNDASGVGTLSLVPADFPTCNAGVGSCIEAHNGPGCDNPDCCLAVCLIDPLCCTDAWDETCAATAAIECAAVPCALDLNVATYSEIEICGDDTNGGCNADPFAFETINSGDIVSGSAWADAGTRDTDWYEFSNILADFDTNGNGMVDIHNNLTGELSVASFIVVNAANDECGTNISTGTTAASQSCIQTGTGVTTVAITDLIHVFVGTADNAGNPIFDGFPCPPPGPANFGANYLLCVSITDDGEAVDTDCPPLTNTCPWDLDGSGTVGTGDLLSLFAQWGTAGPADFDGSGAVGTNDLLILFGNWGPCP